MRFPASAPICRIRRWSASAARSAAASISTRCRRPISSELYRAAADFEKRMRDVPGLPDVNSDLQIASPHGDAGYRPRPRLRAGRHRRPDRERALRRLRRAPGLRPSTRSTDTYWVIMELLPEYQRDPSRLGLLYVRFVERQAGPADRPWRSCAPAVGPLSVAHLGQLPAVTISFNLAPGVSLGDAVDRVEEAGARIPARHHPHQLPGRGRGLPIVARRAWECCSSWRSW